MVSCATTTPRNPWVTPNRNIHVPDSERAPLIASFEPCINHARKTIADAIRKFETGLPEGSIFYVIVFSDEKLNRYIKIQSTGGELLLGTLSSSKLSFKGKNYASGDRIALSPSDIIDWYIVYPDRPGDGNLIGRYILFKQDGIATDSCDPHDIEYKRFRVFTPLYSFVPPGPEGWEFGNPWQEVDIAMQGKNKDLSEVNTVSGKRYEVSSTSTDEELIKQVETFGRYGDEEGLRYNVIKLEAGIFVHKQTRCARLDHIVEDKHALLSKAGKRGLMIRDVQALLCLHPTEKNLGVALIYSHRHLPGKRDPAFIENSDKLFESLAFTTRYRVP